MPNTVNATGKNPVGAKWTLVDFFICVLIVNMAMLLRKNGKMRVGRGQKLKDRPASGLG